MADGSQIISLYSHSAGGDHFPPRDILLMRKIAVIISVSFIVPAPGCGAGRACWVGVWRWLLRSQSIDGKAVDSVYFLKYCLIAFVFEIVGVDICTGHCLTVACVMHNVGIEDLQSSLYHL